MYIILFSLEPCLPPTLGSLLVELLSTQISIADQSIYPSICKKRISPRCLMFGNAFNLLSKRQCALYIYI